MSQAKPAAQRKTSKVRKVTFTNVTNVSVKPDTAIAIYVRLGLDDQTMFYVNRLWITVDHNMNAWFGWSNPFSNLNLARSCLILFLCFLFQTLIWVGDVPTLWADLQTWMQTCQHQCSISLNKREAILDAIYLTGVNVDLILMSSSNIWFQVGFVPLSDFPPFCLSADCTSWTTSFAQARRSDLIHTSPCTKVSWAC